MKTSTCSVIFATLFALAIPRRAEAHGFVSQVQIQGGATFKGPKPGATGANNSPIRGITDQSPVKNLQSKDLICGVGATAGSAVASAKPGDTLVYTWANNVAENGNWIHDTGPMMTYFAQVPEGQTADKFDGVGAQWFKTDEAGKKNNKWVQASLMTGATFKTQIPETLPDGDYLVRHEIVALHNAANKGGVEFYPSCFQLRIKNSNAGNATVTATPTLSFPGAYTATDPGLLVNVFSQAADGSEYKFPAGPIAQVSAPGSTGTSPDAIASQSTTSQTATVVSTTSTSSASTVPVSSTTFIGTSIGTSTAIASTSSTSSSPISTPAPTGLQGIRLANGRAAQELNLRFRTLSISDKCEPREPGCIGGQFASCSAQGTWAIQGACFAGTSCFAIPLKNINGTQVGCFPESVVEQELVDAGVGTAVVSETSTATSTAGSAFTSTVVLTATTTSAATGTSSAVQVTGTPVSSTASQISTSTTSPVSTSAPVSTASNTSSVTPTPTPVSNNGGSPAVVVGVGSRPARRMLRWERRGMNMRF